MEWGEALAELLRQEPEIRSWLELEPWPTDASVPLQSERPLLAGSDSACTRAARTRLTVAS